ncbi:MAG: DUF362 domain-containing protein [Nitrospirota bacterium]
MARVSMIKGVDIRENIRMSLDPIAGEIIEAIGDRRVVIKPNFVSTSIQLAATHADHIRGVLDCLGEFYTRKVIVAEAAAGNTLEGYRNFDYHGLLDEYDLELVDLNCGPFEMVEIEDSTGKQIYVDVASLLMSPDSYKISAARLKTHDAVVVTLSIKNMAMGSVSGPDKAKVHQGIRQTNLNIAKLARLVWPDLAVIDGLEGMEGDGPSFGDPISVWVAISSTDPLAADRVACEVMGVDFSKVGYLNFCEGLGEHDMERIEIVGTPLAQCIKPFKLHSSVEEQYRWK